MVVVGEGVVVAFSVVLGLVVISGVVLGGLVVVGFGVDSLSNSGGKE